MRLIIAEKPSLGRAIAAVLPGPQKKEQGAIYCGNNTCVTWCIGHLLEQAQPEAYNEAYKSWSLATLPIIPEQWQLVPRSDAKAQLSVVRKLIKEADELIHAGDPDREGQLLVDEVFSYCKVSKAKKDRIQRLLISDLNPAAVKKALNSLRSNAEFIPLSVSALARSRADWLYGINLTRALTLQGRTAGYNGVLSVGRVQTPVLGLVVARDRDISDFVPKPYFEVVAHLLTTAQERFKAYWQPSEACRKWQDEEGRVLSRPLAENVAARITNQPAVVKEAERKRGKQSAPLPYNLSALQIDAAKRYGMSAQKVLDCAQALYEKYRLITYPRSDCRYLPKEHLNDKESVVSAIAHNASALKSAVEHADLSLRSSAWNDAKVEAHHAIIPTQLKSRSALPSDEAKVYELVARQYLMQFYPPMQYEDTRLWIEIAGGIFLAKARCIRDAGWKALLGKTEDAEETLPLLQTGDALHCERGEVLDKETQPPKPFTDATLLAAMTGIARYVADKELKKILKETDGLGTEATRAGILELLFRRGFLIREGKAIHATATGKSLVDAVPDSVAVPDLTAQWESQLNAMAQRQGHYDQFMSGLTQSLQGLIADLSKEVPSALHALKGLEAKRGSGRGKATGRRRTASSKTGAKSSAGTKRKSGAAKVVGTGAKATRSASARGQSSAPRKSRTKKAAP